MPETAQETREAIGPERVAGFRQGAAQDGAEGLRPRASVLARKMNLRVSALKLALNEDLMKGTTYRSNSKQPPEEGEKASEQAKTYHRTRETLVLFRPKGILPGSTLQRPA